MYWPDTNTGVDIEPTRKPVASAVRKYFTEGGAGIPVTVPGGDWFNQITNELLNVLAAAGIDPSKTDDDQLLQAIQALNTAGLTLEGVLETSPSWDDVPAYKGGGPGGEMNAQAQALANQAALLKSPMIETSQGLGLKNLPALSEFGALEDTEAMKEALASAKARGSSLVIDEAMSVDWGQLTGSNAPTNTPFSGDVELNGGARKFSGKKHLPQYVPKSTIYPEHHLHNLSLSTSPIVVIIGDSISTYGPNTQANDDSMWGLLQRKLKSENPSKNFVFHNRAIGGKTFADTVLPVSASVPWYENSTKKWYQYVVDLNPDLVFIAFGMNDSALLDWNAFAECVSAINYTKANITFVTTPVPSKAAIYMGESNGWNSNFGQEGRDHAASVVRTYAQYSGHGLIDINRTMVAFRDGFDVTTSPLKQIALGESGFYEIPDKVIDSAFRFTVQGANWPTNASAPTQQPSYIYGGNDADVIFFENIDNTNVNLKIWNSRTPGGVVYLEKSVPIVVPGSTHYFDVSCIGSVVTIYHSTVGFSNMNLLICYNALRGKGYGRARVGSYDVGGNLENISAAGGLRHAQYRQTVTDTEIWNASANNADTQPGYGGNGINHYSSQGIDKIVAPTLAALDFHVPQYERWLAFPQPNGVFSRLDDRTLLMRGAVSLPNTPINNAFGSLFMSNTIVLPYFPKSLFKQLSANGDVDVSISLTLLGNGLGVWIGDVVYDAGSGNYLYRLFCPVARASTSLLKVQYTVVGEINPSYSRVRI